MAHGAGDLAEQVLVVGELRLHARREAGVLQVVAVDGVEAWKSLETSPVDLIVSDVNMPELKMAPVGERAKLIIAPDWDAINASRDDWTKRWNREVER
ncbi:hypothetical protein HC761_01460 [bacterium]|nr:hypothetical protein [bacterium]